MRTVNRRHRRLAWLLILVYLPMLVAISFHHHEEVEDDVVASYCQDCLHHVHHSGHIASTHSFTHDCLLCQLHSTSYLVPTLIVLAVFAVMRRLTMQRSCPKPCLLIVGVRAQELRLIVDGHPMCFFETNNNKETNK